jgi:hypothetical protein
MIADFKISTGPAAVGAVPSAARERHDSNDRFEPAVHDDTSYFDLLFFRSARGLTTCAVAIARFSSRLRADFQWS